MLLFFRTWYWTWPRADWPHANRSGGGNCLWQWYYFWLVSVSNNWMTFLLLKFRPIRWRKTKSQNGNSIGKVTFLCCIYFHIQMQHVRLNLVMLVSVTHITKCSRCQTKFGVSIGCLWYTSTAIVPSLSPHWSSCLTSIVPSVTAAAVTACSTVARDGNLLVSRKEADYCYGDGELLRRHTIVKVTDHC